MITNSALVYHSNTGWYINTGTKESYPYGKLRNPFDYPYSDLDEFLTSAYGCVVEDFQPMSVLLSVLPRSIISPFERMVKKWYDEFTRLYWDDEAEKFVVLHPGNQESKNRSWEYLDGLDALKETMARMTAERTVQI
jgi:hypothetical protein